MKVPLNLATLQKLYGDLERAHQKACADRDSYLASKKVLAEQLEKMMRERDAATEMAVKLLNTRNNLMAALEDLLYSEDADDVVLVRAEKTLGRYK